jgi:hypothetical protein
VNHPPFIKKDRPHPVATDDEDGPAAAPLLEERHQIGEGQLGEPPGQVEAGRATGAGRSPLAGDEGAHPGGEHVAVARLDQEIVDAGGERRPAGRDARVVAEEDERHPAQSRFLHQAAEELEPVDVGELGLGEDEVHACGAKNLQRRRAVGRGDQLQVGPAAQCDLGETPGNGVGVNHQDVVRSLRQCCRFRV